jgi:hypothetical protein
LTARACPSCGAKRGLGDDGRCADKAKCVQRATSSMVTKPYLDFDPDAAYRDAEKGAA